MKSSSEACRLSKKVRLELVFAFSALLRSQTSQLEILYEAELSHQMYTSCLCRPC